MSSDPLPSLELPYFVERTKVGRSLPVYTDVSHNGLKITTIVRRIYGDIAVPLLFLL